MTEVYTLYHHTQQKQQQKTIIKIQKYFNYLLKLF